MRYSSHFYKSVLLGEVIFLKNGSWILCQESLSKGSNNQRQDNTRFHLKIKKKFKKG